MRNFLTLLAETLVYWALLALIFVYFLMFAG